MSTVTKIVFATVAAFAMHLAFAQGTNYRDGNWWMSIDRPTKLVYVVGIYDGMALGHGFSWWKYADDKSPTGTPARATAAYREYTHRFIKATTNVQIADGLDVFYADYRNRSIETSSAIWIVLNEIAGTPKADIERLTEGWRRSASAGK